MHLRRTSSPVGSVDGSSSEHSVWALWLWAPRAFSLRHAQQRFVIPEDRFGRLFPQLPAFFEQSE